MAAYLADDEEDDEFELITDPILCRYRDRIDALTRELEEETTDYPLSEEQHDQLRNTLITLHRALGRVENLATLDAVLRMAFSGDYYEDTADMTNLLTRFPLSGEN